MQWSTGVLDVGAGTVDGLWSTFLGVALPLIGVDTDVLQAAGYTRVPQTCGTMSDREREHVALYALGTSDAVYGEILVVASTEDETLYELFVVAGSRPFEGDPLRTSDDQCTAPTPSLTIEENELGVAVTTELCANGSGVVLRAWSSPSATCGIAETLGPSPFLVSSFLPRRY